MKRNWQLQDAKNRLSRLVAEAKVADLTHAGPGSLEHIFARVTEQPDYTPLAQEILDTIRVA